MKKTTAKVRKAMKREGRMGEGRTVGVKRITFVLPSWGLLEGKGSKPKKKEGKREERV